MAKLDYIGLNPRSSKRTTAPAAIRPPFSVGCPPNGGARRDRTDDLMLAKHALSQLSYGPVRGVAAK